MNFSGLRAVELLGVLSKFGFDEVLKDFKRDTYRKWIRNLVQNDEDVCYAHDAEDSYVFVGDKCEIHMADGASKVVFWSDDDDFVFKIGFNDLARDYCALEATCYGEARHYDLEEFFAATKFLVNYNGVDIYEAERAEVDFVKLSSDLYERLENEGMSEAEITDTIDEVDSCNEFIEWLFPYYTDCDKMEKLLNFLEDYSINDLHSGNIGYIGNRIVIIDYSGYVGQRIFQKSINKILLFPMAHGWVSWAHQSSLTPYIYDAQRSILFMDFWRSNRIWKLKI